MDMYFNLITLNAFMMQMDVMLSTNYCCDALSWMQEGIDPSRKRGGVSPRRGIWFGNP